MIRTEWILCPVCRNKTRDKIRDDTVLKNYPLYCPKCKQETLIEAKNLQIAVIKEPDTLDAEPMNVWETIVCWLCFYISVTSKLCNTFYIRYKISCYEK